MFVEVKVVIVLIMKTLVIQQKKTAVILWLWLLILGTGSSNAQPMDPDTFDDIRVNPFDLPLSFDLRGSGLLSPVSTQAAGGCWASSTMVTVEAWLRHAGRGEYTFSARNMQLNHGFDDSRNTYGNHYMATAYFSRGSGPVERDPARDSVAYLDPQLPLLLREARYLPGAPALIKQTIFDYGPVYSMLYFKRNAVDSATFIFHSPDNPLEHINHVVSLVGWNDTLETPAGAGAWIAQNSLGTKFGDAGFFYIPYEDKSILKHNAVWPDWDDYRAANSIYYYDTLGSFNTYGFNDSICYGLVKYTARTNESIIRLSSHINTPGTFLQFEVYAGFDEANKVLSGKLGETSETPCIFPGYYTLDLPDAIPVVAGQDFYILARYNAPFYKEPLPVEQAIEDYAHPHLTTSKCWVNPNLEKWPDAWYECGTNSEYPALDFDLCIRAITESKNK